MKDKKHVLELIEEEEKRSKCTLEFVKGCFRSGDSYGEDSSGKLWYGGTDGEIRELLDEDDERLTVEEVLELIEDRVLYTGRCCDTFFLVERSNNTK